MVVVVRRLEKRLEKTIRKYDDVHDTVVAIRYDGCRDTQFMWDFFLLLLLTCCYLRPLEP